MDVQVLEKANQLGEAILQSAEYVRLKKSEKDQMANEDALDLLRSYNKMRSEFGKIIAEENPGEDQIDQMRNSLSVEYEKLLQNDIVRESIEAQKDFNEFMQNVTARISAYINPSCDSSSCSSCHGCGSQG